MNVVESLQTKAYIFPSKSPGTHPPWRIPVQVEDCRAPAERRKGRYVLPSQISIGLARVCLVAAYGLLCAPACFGQDSPAANSTPSNAQTQSASPTNTAPIPQEQK